MIYSYPDLDLTLEGERRLVKGCQPSMKKKVWKEMVLCPIGPIDMVPGPVGIVGYGMGLGA